MGKSYGGRAGPFLHPGQGTCRSGKVDYFLGEAAQWISIVSLLETVLRKAKLESYSDDYNLVCLFLNLLIYLKPVKLPLDSSLKSVKNKTKHL